jgi:nucleoside 2-deoxyribosyltransferase
MIWRHLREVREHLGAQESRDQEPDLIYCASRLFALQDRTAILCIANAIDAAISHENLNVFLPFRDTDQASLNGPDKARLIYNHDISTLKRARIVVALVDGISKDDGVAMELGYAFGLGIPFILCSSDFIVSHHQVSSNSFICDPLIDSLAGSTVSENGFHLIGTLPYETAHSEGLENLAATVAANVVQSLSSTSKSPSYPKDPLVANDTFIDIAGGKYAYSEELERTISANATNVSFGNRWKDGCSPTALIRDLQRAMSARRCVFFADSAEMDPGSAFLHGLAVSQNIPVSLFYSSPVLLTGPGGQAMRRNLMLTESAEHIFSTLSSLIEFLA